MNDIAHSDMMQRTASLLDCSDYTLDQYDELIDVMRYHEHRYYVLDDPAIPDAAYDQLMQGLRDIETAHPAFIRSDAPTQRVGTDLSADFSSVTHLSPMLSLANAYGAEDLVDFDRQVRKRLEETSNIAYAIEPKFDGGTVVLVYEDDHLVRGATRGDGSAGDDITANVKAISSIPLRADFSSYGITRIELRGEAIIRKDRFDVMNAQRAADDQETFANPRNTATGGLRTKNPQETRGRHIDAFIYQIAYVEHDGTFHKDEYHDASIEWLRQLGFLTPDTITATYDDIQKVAEHCARWETKRDTYPYEIDGLVIKVNETVHHDILGATSHHPRWAIAYKFKAKQAITRLEDVVYQVGKVGTITPVAKVTPTPLAGVTVSSISLHNADFIQSKDLRIGDQILIERAGDVIPYVVQSFPEMRKGDEAPIVYPSTCPISPPSISVDLVREEDEAAWRCPDCQCGKQDLERIIFFVSKGAMDIDGMGASTARRFYELGWISDIADLFYLDYDEIARLEGFGQRSADRLKDSIERARHQPLHRLLYSLSIHHLGQRAAKIIAAEIEHVNELKTWTIEHLEALKDIGPVVARNLTTWIALPKNQELLHRLASGGVQLHQTEQDRPKERVEGPLTGKTILFTGSLQQMTRKEAQAMAEGLGAKNISAVSKNLDILVVGEKAGSKLKKAQVLGTVTIWTEDEFLLQMS